MKKIILIIVTIAIIFSAVKLLNKRKQSVADMPVPSPIVIQVKVAAAEMKELQQMRPFLAQLTSIETAKISSKLSGAIKNVLVKENQQVKEGELLLQIDDREIMAAVNTQQGNIKAQKKDVQYAKSLHERNRSLFKAGGLAREKFEASAVSLATKQAALETTRQKIIELEVQLSYLNIKAPFDGIIGTINSRKGSLASPAQTLLTINSLGQKLTFSYVPGLIAIETEQVVYWQDKKIGRISNLYSDADNALSVAEVTIESPLALPNKSNVTIHVVTFSGSGCRIPVNALMMTKEGAQLMIYKDQVFTPFSVSIIADNKNYALVEPCPGEPMALASAAKLSELPSHDKVLLKSSDQQEPNG